MAMFDAKAFMGAVKLYNAHIENRLAEIEKLDDMIKRVTGAIREDAGCGGSGPKDKIGDAVAIIVDLKKQIRYEIENYKDKRNEVTAILDQMRNADQVKVLHKLYFQDQSWEEIAKSMNRSERSAQNIHGKALIEVQKLLRLKSLRECS